MVYRIWNKKLQCWYTSAKGRSIWMKFSGCKLAMNYAIKHNWHINAEDLEIYSFDLTNKQLRFIHSI